MPKQSGRLDALINNAGILLDEDKDVLTLTAELFEATLRTNTLGALLVAQGFVACLRKSDKPPIVNVSSGGGQLTEGADGSAPGYCISKTALNSVTVELPPPCQNLRSTPSVPAGGELTWAARTQPVPLPKVLQELSGWRRKHHNAKPGSFGATAK